jgi:hypothetical protein
MAGYIVSGAAHLRLLPWFYGPKGTGESTISELLKTILGSEAVAVEARDFSKEVPRKRLGAKIWGKRLIVSSEAGEERLSAETLKQVSGGDTMPVPPDQYDVARTWIDHQTAGILSGDIADPNPLSEDEVAELQSLLVGFPEGLYKGVVWAEWDGKRHTVYCGGWAPPVVTEI